MLVEPSKKIFISAVIASFVLHFFVCKIPVHSKLPEKQDLSKKITISLYSLAAPSVPEPQKIVEKIEPKKAVEKKKISPKKVVKKLSKKKSIKKAVVKSPVKPVKKVKNIDVRNFDKVIEKVVKKKVYRKQPDQVKRMHKSPALLTNNNIGKQKSNVVPVLKATDFVQTVAPYYPKRAVRRGIQGSVMVRVEIGYNGAAKSVSLASSSGFEMLDSSAMKAVSKWKFNNSALSKSVRNWVLVPVKFIIQ